MTTIITSTNHGFDVGETITITTTVSDMRWWKRLWCYITFQSPPFIFIRKAYEVDSVTHNTITVK